MPNYSIHDLLELFATRENIQSVHPLNIERSADRSKWVCRWGFSIGADGNGTDHSFATVAQTPDGAERMMADVMRRQWALVNIDIDAVYANGRQFLHEDDPMANAID